MTDFQKAISSRSLEIQQKKVLAVLKEFPYRTSNELALKVNPEVISREAFHKRLPELRKNGLVVNSLSRKCTVTHRKAQVWVPVEA